jgi:membrane-bound lytic murein transglycosylase B
MTLFRFLIVLWFGMSCQISAARAADQDFQTWLNSFKHEAQNQGISQKTIDEALTGITPIQKVIELDRKQPEKKMTFAQYKKNVISSARIAQGREMLRTYHTQLSAVEKKYGVPKEFIVALWGVETSYGKNTGGFKIIPALATLAWEGRRSDFFKDELIKALKIIDEGHISAANMKGSWAGAMGQNQFMPSSFFAYAVDENKDGQKDIWNTKLDIFASTANYLSKSGWIYGERWGRRVQLPKNFSKDLATPKIGRSLTYWSGLGVRDYSGEPLPQSSMVASIVAPDGVGGEAYIVYENYQTIMKWNRSTYFATSVGLIADALSRQ